MDEWTVLGPLDFLQTNKKPLGHTTPNESNNACRPILAHSPISLWKNLNFSKIQEFLRASKEPQKSLLDPKKSLNNKPWSQKFQLLIDV